MKRRGWIRTIEVGIFLRHFSGVSSAIIIHFHLDINRGRAIKKDVRKSLRRVMDKAGLSGVTLHTLRHTFASQLVMAGVSLRDVQELMGHQNFQTTLRYAHLSPDHVKKQVLNLPFASG